jgi:peptidoglycan/xylan/chitin deacetylase (PgdA/CDA1 family)
MKKNAVIITVASVLLLAAGLVFVLVVVVPQTTKNVSSHGQSSTSSSASSTPQQPLRCNCVIFRADDIQDYWEQKPQVTLLDTFINKSVPLSVGMVMNHYGSDPLIVGKVKAAGPLFEYDLHGWNHVDYTTLNAPQQEESISQAQAKMLSVMGKNAKVFLPPYNNFDANTLAAMRISGLQIISSSKTDTSPYAPANDTLGISHMPQSINYGYVNSTDNTSHVWRTLAEMKSAVDADIGARGWAVVTVHPQDFAKYDENGKMLDTSNEKRADTLKTFIDQLRSEGKTLTTFEGAMQIMNNNNNR